MNTGIDKTVIRSGDSLTARTGASLPSILPSLIGNKIIEVQAIGGQKTEQIACRMGVEPIYVTTSGSFSGTTGISITSISNQFLSTLADTNTRFQSGVLNGIQCVIKREVISTVETYTIFPAISSTVTIPNNSIFFPDTRTNYMSAIHIIWWGRNDVTATLSTVKSYIDKQIANLIEPKRFFVIGILNSYTETIGSSSYNQIQSVNNTIRTAYPNNYIEINPPSQSELDYFRYTMTSQDLTDLGNGVFQTGLRSDSVHLNDLGYSIVDKRIFEKLKINNLL